MRPKYLLGVDLAASTVRPTGISLMRENLTCMTWAAHKDHEILEAVAYFRPAAVAFDAPLSMPRAGPLRRCERELIHEGVRLLPPTLGTMRQLTMRGIRLARRVRRMGAAALETYPRGVLRFLGLEASRNPRYVASALNDLGVVGLTPNISIHEVDGAICSLVAYLWLKGRVREYGDRREGVIIMPKPSARQLLPPS